MTKLKNSTGKRLSISVIIGFVAWWIAMHYGHGQLGILIGWDVAVLVFVVWVLAIILPMGHQKTSEYALREDPSRGVADVVLILASLASLGAVGYVLYEANKLGNVTEQLILTGIGIVSVIVSWVLIHTINTLRYARLYYSHDVEGTVDFKKDHKPAYSDFVYLAFTIGMTYQVADTDLVGTEFRKTVLRHAILSYVFGTVIVAITINLVASLGR